MEELYATTFWHYLTHYFASNISRFLNCISGCMETKEEILVGKHGTYYKVTISQLYDSTVTDQEPKKKIVERFLKDRIAEAIFERYPLKIFNKEVNFSINGKTLNPKDFVIGEPIKKAIKYLDKKGSEHKVLFDFMHHKRTATKKDSSLCANATIALLNLIGIMQDRV